MRNVIKLLLIFILTILLLGCSGERPIEEDYIGIKKLYNENKEVIDKVVAHIDIKTAAEKFDFEYVSNEVFLESKFQFPNIKKIDGVRFKYERIMYYFSDKISILVLEMKNEEAAKEACEKYESVNPNKPIFYEKNVVYFDPVIFNLLIKNYYIEGDNYITLDNTIFLTNISNEEILYIPEVKEIAKISCFLNTNIKKVYMSTNLEKINNGAFNCCFNLENVYLNDGLKVIDDYSFYHCESLKYIVLPESVEKIGNYAFSHGIIYCEALEKPEGWEENFAYRQAKVYWGNEWEYNEEGIPVLK